MELIGHANAKTTETYAHVNFNGVSASLSRRGSLSQPGAESVQIDREEEPSRQKDYVFYRSVSAGKQIVGEYMVAYRRLLGGDSGMCNSITWKRAFHTGGPCFRIRPLQPIVRGVI